MTVCAVQYVGLTPGNIFDMSCVDQIDPEAPGLKNMIKRDPEDSGGFHGHGIDSPSLQPICQAVQFAGKRLKRLHWLRVAIGWYGPVMFFAPDVNSSCIQV